MNTLANCTPAELAAQMCKISDRLKNYKDGLDKIAKITALDNDGTPLLDDNGNKIEKTDIWGIINYICGDNVRETMALCGEMCFMSAEKFAALDPKNGDPDGIVEVMNILSTPRVLAFFTTSLRLKNFFAGL